MSELVRRCPVCDSAGLDPLFDVRDRQHGIPGRFGVVRCSSCGSGILSPRPAEDELAAYYPSDYGPYAGESRNARRPPFAVRAAHRGLSVVPRLLPDRAASVLRELRVPPRQGARVLDIGCGDGRHLARDASVGWDAIGLDFSEHAVAAARGRGLDVRLGSLEDADLPARSFDLVRMNHVVEHLADPIGALARARELLAGRGRIQLATPNFASPTAAVLGTYWLGIDAPRHLVLFTPASLKLAASRAGLDTLLEAHETAPSDFWASVHYWAEERWPAATRVPRLKHNIVLRQALYPVWWALARTGRSERMHFVLAEAAG